MRGPTLSADGTSPNLGLDDLRLGGGLGLDGRRSGGDGGGNGNRGSDRGGGLGLGGLLGGGGLGGGGITSLTTTLGLDHGILVGGRGVGLLELRANRGNIGVPGLLALRGNVVALALTLGLLGLGGVLDGLGDLLGGLLERLLQGSDGVLERLELLTEGVELRDGGGVSDGSGIGGGHLVLYLSLR